MTVSGSTPRRSCLLLRTPSIQSWFTPKKTAPRAPPSSRKPKFSAGTNLDSAGKSLSPYISNLQSQTCPAHPFLFLIKRFASCGARGLLQRHKKSKFAYLLLFSFLAHFPPSSLPSPREHTPVHLLLLLLSAPFPPPPSFPQEGIVDTRACVQRRRVD